MNSARQTSFILIKFIINILIFIYLNYLIVKMFFIINLMILLLYH